ncbi:MAG: cytochrome c family protein, partial [Desulfobacteraceae bacterium]|nr:cytochrome c family protein [Desulfobacteraceae bacterium]
MSKVTSFQLIMIVTTALFLFPFLAQTKSKDSGIVKAPDLITIDLPADIFGNEMPAVDFSHAIHSQAVDNRCDKCHIRKDDETLIFAFQRTDQAPSMELYHENCLACHEEKKAAKKPSGPLTAECRSCHGAASEPADAQWKKMVFDKSLHYIHETSENISSRVQSDTDNCSACHHEYNEKTNEIFYAKGEESACVYCHQETKTDGIRSMQTAAHDACVACHVSTAGKELPAGPVTCYGCHDEQEQAKIKVVENIPRLKRNQPDAVFMTGLASEGESPEYLMTPVAFDHKGHEETAL